MRFLIVTFTIFMMASSLQAASVSVIKHDIAQPFDNYITRLKTAIFAHKMGVVSEACATCGAKSIGVEIAGNRIIMIFNPHFAVRMLKASVQAGIEAPLRLYITEKSDGMVELSYRQPSDIFKPYGRPVLDKMALELDVILAKIVADSL